MKRPESVGKERLNKRSALILGIVHVMALLAPFYFSWVAFGIAITMFFLSGWIGIALGYHRLFTHNSFETYRPVKYLIAVLGTLSMLGAGPAFFVGVHRKHHKDTDNDADPHTPRHGIDWAHVFWTIYDSPQKPVYLKLARDIRDDKWLRLIDHYALVPQVILGVCFFIGGYIWTGLNGAISLLLWGIGVQTVLVFHMTSAVNSIGHVWGYKNFKTPDDSKNVAVLAVVSGGESWHNNHHADPRAASHGMRWFELDPIYWIIVTMSWIGLAWDIKKPKMWEGEST